MRKSSTKLRDFFGGLIALGGASLVCWQAVLIYLLLVGRVEVGEEHPPFTVIAVFLVIGVLLVAAGYKISNPAQQKSVAETQQAGSEK